MTIRLLSDSPPRLSQSIAGILLNRSPFHAWTYHRQLGGCSLDASKPMDTGTLVDERVFGGDKIVAYDFKDWRTNAAKDAKREARAAGKVPVLLKDAQAVQPIVDRINERLVERGITRENGWRFQDQLQWEQDGVPCEGKPDIWGVSEDGFLDVIDLKTTKEINTPKLNSKATEWAIQCAAYPWALQILRPEYAGRIRWWWLLAETAFPFDVRWAPADTTIRLLGERKWLRAIEQWRELLSRGWEQPWRSEDVTISAAPWALANEEAEDYDDEEER